MITDRMNDTPVDEKFIREILRFGLRKLHNISAYLGGAAAQECVKMLIQQYTPIQNTLVYDGIHGRGQMFNL
jgi:NEDD8-activating enzyme E1 regulatory subunit